MNILLLTASIDANLASPIHTKLTNTKERLSQYQNALKRYIEESDFDTFIFCENTGYNFPKKEFEELAFKCNKTIEFLSFVSNIENVNKFGKGYGEGECLEYAIKKSKFLQDERISFFKITGRLFIENINKILIKSRKNKNCFFTEGITSESVKTAFFKSEVSFFRQYLLNCYKDVNDSENKFLEYIYFEILINKKVNGVFPYPNITGNSGSTGNPYVLKNEYQKLNFLNSLGVFSLNKKTFFLKRFLKNNFKIFQNN